MSQYLELAKTWSKQLNQKFKSSIWWNALPTATSSDRMDMFKTHPGDKDFKYRWMRKLLESSETTIDILPDAKTDKLLHHIYFNAQAKAQLNENITYGFGYPLIVTQSTSGEVIAAPLFVWELDVKLLEQETYKWRLSRNTNNPILINHYLLHFLEKEHQLKLDNSYKNAVSGNHLNSLHLLKLSNEIALKLQFDGNLTSLELEELPSADVCKEVARDNGKIFWSGVLGVYPKLPIKSLKLLESQTIDFSLNTPVERKHNFTALVTDPTQEKAVRGLEKAANIVIEGLHTTGKTYTTTALISNALVNGQKILVVSNNRKTLQSIQKEVQTWLGFGNLCLLLTNIKNKADFLAALENNVTSSKKNPPFEEEEYQHLLNQLNRNLSKLDTHYDSFNESVLFDKKWIEVVGDFLENHYEEGKQLLNSQLLASDYIFDEDNYEQLKALIIRAKSLFSKINTLSHPLEVLHQDIFTTKTQDEAREFTTNKIQESLGIVSDVFHQYVMKLEDYGEMLRDLYEGHYQELLKKAEQIHEDISDYQKRYGDDFDKVGVMKDTKLKLFGMFSERSRNILNIKKDLLEKYNELKIIYWNKRYFDYTFSEIKGGITFEKVAQNLGDFEASLKTWQQQIPTQIHNEVQRLSTQTIHPHLEFEKEVVQLKEQLTTVLTQLNNTEVHQQSFNVDELLVLKNRSFLEKVADQHEGLKFHLRDFDDYYNWKSFWLPLDEPTKNLIKALIKTKPDSWEIAFNSWFLHHVLEQFSHKGILQDEALLQQFLEQNIEIKKLIPLKIKNYWSHRQNAAIRHLKKIDKSLHNTLFGKRKNEILQNATVHSLIQEQFDFWTTTFPVFCTTPEIANDVLPLNHHQFDMVIIEDANHITPDMAARPMWSGKQLVVIGDGQLDTFTGSVLEFAKANFETYTLGYQYDVSEMATFRNLAFAKNNLKTNHFNALRPLNRVAVQYSLGRCSEATRTNGLEIEDVIQVLSGLTYQENESVAIMTFTKQQRNAILENLHNIKLNKGENHRKFEQFMKNGLTVAVADELHDYNFDHLIVSTTFSPEMDIPFLNEAQGYSAIYTIVNAVKSSLVICTSLPKDYIKEHRFKYKNQGLNVLCNLLAYLEAKQEKDAAKEQDILDSMFTTPATQLSVIDKFKQQLMAKLSQHIDPVRIQEEEKTGNLNFDFVVNSIHENEPSVAFWLDGLFWRYSKGAYLWEDVDHNQTKDLGYQYHNVWSVDWWKNPDKAPIRLAEQIKEHDKAYSLIPTITAADLVEKNKPSVVQKTIESEKTEDIIEDISANNVSDVSEAN